MELQVKNRLCELSDVNKEWVLSRWDGAHRIELGMDEVREEVKYYHDLAAIVSSSQSKYFYGKGYERVRAADWLRFPHQ